MPIVPRAPTKQASGFVYFITSESGFCKIGRATRTQQRLAELQIGNPDRLALSHSIECDDPGICEKFFHRILMPCRVSGEWYALPSDFLENIKSIPALSRSDFDIYKPLTTKAERIHAWAVSATVVDPASLLDMSITERACRAEGLASQLRVAQVKRESLEAKVILWQREAEHAQSSIAYYKSAYERVVAEALALKALETANGQGKTFWARLFGG